MEIGISTIGAVININRWKKENNGNFVFREESYNIHTSMRRMREDSSRKRIFINLYKTKVRFTPFLNVTVPPGENVTQVCSKILLSVLQMGKQW